MNLFNSPILDISLTLVFIYFMLGLIVSSLNEIAMSFLKKRQEFLKEAINGLLFDEHWKGISTQLINSPFIQSLKKRDDHFPAYIPSRSFAQAMIDVIRNNKDTELTVKKIREELIGENSPIKGETKKLLLGLLDQAENDFSKFQSGLEVFYDDAMDRANGWYKKYVRTWIFCISITLCALLNVDSILITKRLWQDPSLAKQSADLIQENMKNIGIDSTRNFAVIKTDASTDTMGLVSIDNSNVDEAMNKSATSNLKKNVNNIKVTTAIIKELPIPIGWGKGNYPLTFWGWFPKLFGWLLTAFALMLGAPFWFDLLNKIVNLRSTGKKPLKGEEDPSLTKK